MAPQHVKSLSVTRLLRCRRSMGLGSCGLRHARMSRPRRLATSVRQRHVQSTTVVQAINYPCILDVPAGDVSEKAEMPNVGWQALICIEDLDLSVFVDEGEACEFANRVGADSELRSSSARSLRSVCFNEADLKPESDPVGQRRRARTEFDLEAMVTTALKEEPLDMHVNCQTSENTIGDASSKRDVELQLASGTARPCSRRRVTFCEHDLKPEPLIAEEIVALGRRPRSIEHVDLESMVDSWAMSGARFD